MQIISTVLAATAAFGLASAGVASSSTSMRHVLEARASFPIPASKGNVKYSAPKTFSGVFDGGMKTYGRGVKCTGDDEGGDKDAVFILENGATLKNAIIGADQIEGVHCKGACTIENVWFSAVCEDAISIKGNGNALIKGGGATKATDKVVQHNGFGTVTIDGFTAVNFGKLYRSCGNCKGNGGTRHVVIKNVKTSSGKLLAGINSNYGDTATITSTCASSVKDICTEFTGNNSGKEPTKKSTGVSKSCKYTNPLPGC